MQDIKKYKLPGHDLIKILPGKVLNANPRYVCPRTRNIWDKECFLAHCTGIADNELEDRRICWLEKMT